jgi:hypothetical protein
MTRSDGGVPPDPIAAVMVCSHGACTTCGPPTLEALRPLVARSPRAMLVATGCVHPHGTCPASSEACGVRLQHCTDELRPVGPSVAVAGTTRATYRQVAAWLDQPRSR